MNPNRRRSGPPPTGPLGSIQARLEAFFLEDIWRPDADELGWPLAPLYRVLRVGQLAIRGIIVNRSTFTAAALAYVTILSLVPLLAFAFSVAKGMGAYEKLHGEVIVPFLDRNLGVVVDSTPESIRTLRDAIDRILELVSATNVSSLGALGLGILVFAVIRVLSSVEDSFNVIFGVRRARSWIRKMADYLSLAVVTPLLMVLAVALTTGAQDSGFVELMRTQPILAILLDNLFGLAPLVSVWIGFTMLLLLLPNTSVRPVSALLGGIVGGSAWQLAQIGHAKFQIGIANYNAIYSSFAAIPIFLIWVYVSWLMVMFGAEFTYAHMNTGRHRQLLLHDLSIPRSREILALRACMRIARRFLESKPAYTMMDLCSELSVPSTPLGQVLRPLVDAGILSESGGREGPTWLPGRDPATVRVDEILNALRGEGGAINRDDPGDQTVLAGYEALRDALHETPANVDLKTLAESGA